MHMCYIFSLAVFPSTVASDAAVNAPHTLKTFLLRTSCVTVITSGRAQAKELLRHSPFERKRERDTAAQKSAL